MSYLNGNTNESSNDAKALNRLREARLRVGLTLEEVAERLGRSVVTVTLEEKPDNDLSISTLRTWSAALEVPVGELLIGQASPIGMPCLTRKRIEQMEQSATKIIGSARGKATVTFAQGLLRQIRELFDEYDHPPDSRMASI